jgi:hypothetical protein
MTDGHGTNVQTAKPDIGKKSLFIGAARDMLFHALHYACMRYDDVNADSDENQSLLISIIDFHVSERTAMHSLLMTLQGFCLCQ